MNEQPRLGRLSLVPAAGLDDPDDATVSPGVRVGIGLEQLQLDHGLSDAEMLQAVTEWVTSVQTVVGHPPGEFRHHYLSTGCLHAREDTSLGAEERRKLHAYCQGRTGHCGTKKPAECKFCSAPCVCACHQPELAGV